MHQARRQAAATIVLSVISLIGSAAVADAAQPSVQACVGTTFSGAAHTLPPGGVGTTVSGFAHQPGAAQPGLGTGIQQLQAGQVPDSVVPNTCNG